MDTAERLAAYLAGDLDAAETSAVEEELARDPALRAQLSAMRRADGALLALRTPTPPPGFEDRVRHALEPVLAEELGLATQRDEPAPGTFDELAMRRDARAEGRSRWLPALAGVAAAAAAVVVVANIGFGSGDDAVSDMAVDEDAADDAAGAEMFEAPETADDEAVADAGPPAPVGPTVVASDRSLDEAAIDDLLATQELQDVVAQHYTGAVGEAVADDWSRTLGVDAFAATDDSPQEETDSADEGDGDAGDTMASDGTEAAPLLERGTRALEPQERETVSRCLSYLADADGAPTAIPAYVELGTFQGEEVVVFGLVTEDPNTGAFTRRELWVAGRDDCEPRYFGQG